MSIRTIDMGTHGRIRENNRFVKVFTLVYDATLPTGETVRFVRDLSAAGVEHLGRALTAIPLDDDRIGNIGVTDRTGEDFTFDFECFRAEERPTSLEHQRIAMALLTFVPPAAV